MIQRRAILGAAALGALAGADVARAFGGHQRLLRILVPFAAGGAGDLAARALADSSNVRGSWDAVVENKPGAAGIVGALAAFRAPNDGSAIFLGHSDPIVLHPLTHRSLAYDAAKFEPVAYLSRVPGVLLARAASGIASGAALIAAARARPEQVTYASSGMGSSLHLGMEWLQQLAGIELLHVPFQSTVAAVQALLAGEVDLAWVTPEFALKAAAARKALIVGGSSATRIATAPSVAPLSEQGFPGFDLDTWYGFFAPPGTPAHAIDSLHETLNAAARDPEVADALRRAGHEVGSMTVPEFVAFVDADRRRWRDLIASRRLAFDLR